MSDLKVMVVGVGALGQHHARIVSEMDGVELVAVADPREEIDTSISLWGALSPEQTSSEDTVAIEQQLRALVLRFHSRTLPEGESPRLAHWRWLFETASLVDHTPISGWRALCIALITHPDFYSY